MSKLPANQKTFPPVFETTQVLTVAAGHFVHDVFSSFLAPWLPLLIDKLGLSLTLAGSLSVFIRMPSVLNPFVGVIADRIDMRYMVIAAPGVTAVCMSSLGLVPNYGVAALLLFIAGISVAIFHVPAPVMIARVSGCQVGKGMSFFATAGELARTTGPLVAVAAVSLLGFDGAYPVMTIGLLASALLYWRLRHATTFVTRKRRTSVAKTWQVMRYVLIPLTCLVVARGLMVASLTAFLPTYMAGQGQSLWVGGMALATLELAGALGTSTSGTASDRLGRRFVLVATMIVSPILMLTFLLIRTWVVFPVLVILGFSVFAASPVMLAIVQDHAHGMRATANGIYMAINFLVMSAIIVFVGWMGDLVGLRAAFASSAILSLAGIPAIYFLPREGVQKDRM